MKNRKSGVKYLAMYTVLSSYYTVHYVLLHNFIDYCFARSESLPYAMAEDDLSCNMAIAFCSFLIATTDNGSVTIIIHILYIIMLVALLTQIDLYACTYLVVLYRYLHTYIKLIKAKELVMLIRL